MDNGATNHITSDLNNLTIRSEYRSNDKLFVGNGDQLVISHVGHNKIRSHNTPHDDLHLKQLLCVPSITKHLLNISKFTKDNAFAEFYAMVVL